MSHCADCRHLRARVPGGRSLSPTVDYRLAGSSIGAAYGNPECASQEFDLFAELRAARDAESTLSRAIAAVLWAERECTRHAPLVPPDETAPS